MLMVKPGEIYKALTFKSGTGEKGDWELVHIADDKGKNRTTIFITNVPSGVRENGQFKVKSIDLMKIGMKKDQRTQAWHLEASAGCTVEAIASDIDPVFTELGEADGDDWELPL